MDERFSGALNPWDRAADRRDIEDQMMAEIEDLSTTEQERNDELESRIHR